MTPKQAEIVNKQIVALAAKLATQATTASGLVVPKLLDPRELRSAQLDISALLLERAFEARSRGEA